MKLVRNTLIVIYLTTIGCSFVDGDSKKSNNVNSDNTMNVYAENKEGEHLVIKTNNKGDAYFKMRGANYSNHYFGTLINKKDTIKFILESTLSLHKCKSGKYGENILGVAFGNDEKALRFFKDFLVRYKTSAMNEAQIITINDLQNYIELLGEENVVVTMETNKNEFLKSESIEFYPKTTMLCVSAKNRSSEFQFIVSNDNIKVANYFGKTINYKLKNPIY